MVYILFFMELHTRRVYVSGCTSEPTSAWVTQQARQITWAMQARPSPVRFLIHDRDTKFSAAFEAVFVAEGIEIILAPPQAPNANAFAERWVRTVREECLDHMLIFSEQQLLRVLKEYLAYYNHARPHQGLEQQAPIPFALPLPEGSIRRHAVLGGLIHDYYREAAKCCVS
jgi:putative transposase